VVAEKAFKNGEVIDATNSEVAGEAFTVIRYEA